jgi:hypothetical protein
MRAVSQSIPGPGKRVTDTLICGHVVVAAPGAKKRRCLECQRDDLKRRIESETIPISKKPDFSRSWFWKSIDSILGRGVYRHE